MNYKNLFGGGGDELEFMPIIPMNEDGGDNTDDQVIPSVIPLLPLRNTVLFPGVVLPITVGREKSVRAVNDVYKTDKLVGVISQIDSSIEEPTVSDLVEIGTVAKIIKLIKMPDGGTTIIIQGKKRFKVEEITTEDPYFKARITTLEEQEIKDDPDFDAMVGSIKELAAQIIQLSPNLPAEASLILKNIESPAFLIHFVSSNLNCPVSEKQKLLEINNLKARAEVLMGLMQTELQYAELKNKVTSKTRAELDKQQKDYFLQQQLKAIKEELGGDNVAEVKEMQKKAD
jgi:ATP-dependent Lon protease